jgi:hypothetical protein
VLSYCFVIPLGHPGNVGIAPIEYATKLRINGRRKKGWTKKKKEDDTKTERDGLILQWNELFIFGW